MNNRKKNTALLLTGVLVGTMLNRIDVAPEATEFLKELLAPGSTR